MAEYLHIETMRYPVTEREIREENPNVSFPFPFQPPDGYAVVFQSPLPEYDQVIRSVRLVSPSEVNGKWYQTWEVVPRFVEYTDEAGVTHSVEGQEAAAVAADQAARAQALQQSIVAQTQQRLDDFAITRGYDDIKSASDYAGCSVPKFNAEGTYCRDARAETWVALYQILAEIEAGTRPVPSGYADIEPLLPQLVWPT